MQKESQAGQDSLALRRYVKLLLFFIGSLFFIGLMASTWKETTEFLRNIKWFPFSVAVILGIADHIVVSLVFQNFLEKYGITLPYTSVGKMYFFGQMTKYIPGRLWNVLYQRSFVELDGAIGALFVVNLELIAAFTVRNTFVAFTIIFASAKIILGIVVLLVGFTGFWLVGRSDTIVRTLAWVSKQLKRPLGVNIYAGSLPTIHRLFYLYLAAAVTFLASSFLMMYAAFDLSITESYIYIALFGLAWVVGVLTVIVPAGLGVREVVFIALANLSGTNLSLETLAALAIIYRFWHVLQEIGGLVFAALLSLFSSYITCRDR